MSRMNDRSLPEPVPVALIPATFRPAALRPRMIEPAVMVLPEFIEVPTTAMVGMVGLEPEKLMA